MTQFMTKIWDNLVNLFFPNLCVVCGKYGFLLCPDCLCQIEKNVTSTCPECGRITVNCRFCPRCRGTYNKHIHAVFVATSYHSVEIKKLIKSLKYQGLTALSEVCGELIYQRIKKMDLPSDLVIVPVPLHHYKYNRRGFNQSELIARYLSKRLTVSGADALVRKKDTKSQARLPRKERLENMIDAFQCRDREFICDKNILLIDDVLTTGSTLNECARILKNSGAKRVYGAVVTRNR